MNHPLFYFALSALLTCLGFLCLQLTKSTHGKGSGRLDNELRILCGVLWGWAFVAAALGVAMGVAQ